MSIPSAVASAAEVQTTEDGKFTYTCNYYDETATIHEYLGEETVVTFPSEVDGCKVTAISNINTSGVKCVIADPSMKEKITKIVIPDTVKVIADGAFRDLTALETVKMPSKIEEVGGFVFFNCSSLKKISFPSTLKKFSGSYMTGLFGDCTELEEVSFAKNTKITEIPANTFRGCTSLKKVTLPNKIKRINKCAFYECNELQTINFPNTLEVLEEYAFKNCFKLTNIKIGSKITELGKSAFANTGIKKVTIPKNVILKGNVFYGCANLKSAVISKGVSMGRGEFEDCVKLEKVTIKSGVTGISNEVFKGTALKTVVIPNTVKYIGSDAFKDCSKLVKVFILGDDVRMGGFTAGTKVRLYGYKNSTVQTYAKQVGVRFKALTTVKSLKAKNSAKGKVKLTWKKVSGVKTYTIYRSTSKNGTYKKIGTTKKLSFTDKKAKKGKTYYYRIVIDYEDSTGVKLTGVKSSSVKIKVKK